MAIKRVWIGSTGPFLFDRGELIPEDPDADPLLNVNQAPLVFETETGDIITIDAAISDLEISVDNKQDVLVSGTNIKTINGETLLGAGNIVVVGSGGGNSYFPSGW